MRPFRLSGEKASIELTQGFFEEICERPVPVDLDVLKELRHRGAPRFNAMLRRLYEIVWYTHIGASLCDPRFTLGYIGRYTKRAVLAEYRITHYDAEKGLVRFAYRDYAQSGKTAYKTLPVLAFIGRLIRHIPDKHFKMVRYAGLFATRWRQHYLVHARAALGQSQPVSPVAEETPACLLSRPAMRRRGYPCIASTPLKGFMALPRASLCSSALLPPPPRSQFLLKLSS